MIGSRSYSSSPSGFSPNAAIFKSNPALVNSTPGELSVSSFRAMKRSSAAISHPIASRIASRETLTVSTAAAMVPPFSAKASERSDVGAGPEAKRNVLLENARLHRAWADHDSGSRRLQVWQLFCRRSDAGPFRRAAGALSRADGRNNPTAASREEPAGTLAAFGWRADLPALPTIDAAKADFLRRAAW